MISFKDLIWISVRPIVMDSKGIMGISLSDRSLKTYWNQVVHALKWVPIPLNSPVLREIINMLNQLIDIHEEHSLWGANQLILSNMLSGILKRMIIPISLINSKQDQIGLVNLPMKTHSLIPILSILQRKLRFLKNYRKNQIIIVNTVLFYLLRNNLQKRFHNKEKSPLPCKSAALDPSSRPLHK